MPDPAARPVMRTPFHKPPPYRRVEAPPPRPEVKPTPAPTVSLSPTPGRFSLVPDGSGHRLVYARPGETAAAPVVRSRLTVQELRQLAATLNRYLGAVDPNGGTGSTPDMSLVTTPAPKKAE
jgi:hypothetical protein